MTPVRSFLVVAACLAHAAPLSAQAQTYTIDQFLSPASPLEMSA